MLFWLYGSTYFLVLVNKDNYLKPRTKFQRDLLVGIANVSVRMFLSVLGFFYVKFEEYDIHDFWADYEPIQDTTNSAVMISNHTSYLDMFVYLMAWECPSFLSKYSVSKIPIVSHVARLYQTLFIKRKSAQDRALLLEAIEERVDLASKGEAGPIMIFPEGTTTNGRAMMKFKRGAFVHEKPIKVTSLYYSGDFLPCLDLTRAINSIFLIMCLPYSRITYKSIRQPVDPLWILKKHGRKPGMEDNWEVIAKEVKELMCFAFGLDDCKMSFKEKCEFDCEVQGLTKEQLFKRG